MTGRSPRDARGRADLAAALLGLALACSPAGAQAPAATPEPAPAVVVLSLDGVRPDYLDRGRLPALDRMAREGARAEALVPVFPSSTFPNHVSLATGTHPDRHGIVANRFLDPELGEFDYGNDARFLDAEPLWAAAERQGVRAAVFFWVGSETDWRGVGASYRKAPFDGGVPESEKVEQILAWLDLPAGERPGLVMSWWHGADAPAHRYGPDNGEVDDQLRGQDRELGRLLAGLDARGAWAWTTLLVVSDHGMVAVTESVDARAILEAAGIRAQVVQGGAYAHVHLADPGQRDAAVRALAAEEGVRAMAADELPEALRARHATRNGDVVALADPPRMLSRATGRLAIWGGLRSLLGQPVGTHGYDPTRVPEMHGILLALGRGVAPGTSLGHVHAIDVAPTVARLLGIEPPRHAEGAAVAGIGPVPGAPERATAPGAAPAR